MIRKHLVIVGGGWAGMSLVRSLKNVDPKKLRITLISNEPNFRYSPGLYRVATGSREREAIIPIGEVLGDIAHVDFVLDTATKVDRKTRTVKTSSGKIYSYDFAVIGLGMVTSYFGIPGIEENSYSIKTATGLRKFKTHLHKELTDQKAQEKNYVVVGAGATGIELAAALGTYLRQVKKWHGLDRQHISIDLVEAMPHILPESPAKVGHKVQARLKKLGVKVMVGAKVESESVDTLTVSGVSIPTKTVVWTAGVTNNPFYTANKAQFLFNERGKVIVDDHLMIDKHTYVIGDSAATQYSGLAITAVHNAHYVARDIKRQLHNLPRINAYKPAKPPTVIPVGSRWAIMQYGSFSVSGIIGSAIRIFADFVGYMDVLGFWKAVEVWTSESAQEEQCAVCKVQLTHKHGSTEFLEID